MVRFSYVIDSVCAVANRCTGRVGATGCRARCGPSRWRRGWRTRGRWPSCRRAASGDGAARSLAGGRGRRPPEPAGGRPAGGGRGRAGRPAGCGAGSRLCQQPHAVLLFFRARAGRCGGQQHRAGPCAPVRGPHPAGGCAGDLQPAPQGGQQPAFRLPHRRGHEGRPPRRHAVPDAGRAFSAHAGRADAGQPPRQDRAYRQGWQRAEGQPLCRPPRRAARDLELRPPQSPGRHAGPGRAAVDARARPAGRRRDQPAAARAQLRLAGHHLWRAVRRRPDRRGHHGQSGHGAAAAPLDPVDRALGHGLSDQ
jgi:hypothetical protein